MGSLFSRSGKKQADDVDGTDDNTSQQEVTSAPTPSDDVDASSLNFKLNVLGRAPLTRSAHVNDRDTQLSAVTIANNKLRRARRDRRERLRTEIMERESCVQHSKHVHSNSCAKSPPRQTKRCTLTQQGNASKKSRWDVLEPRKVKNQQSENVTRSSIACGQPQSAEQQATSTNLPNDVQLPVNSMKAPSCGLEISMQSRIASGNIASDQAIEQQAALVKSLDDVQLPSNSVKPGVELISCWMTDGQSPSYFSSDAQHSLLTMADDFSNVQRVLTIVPLAESWSTFDSHDSDMDVILIPSADDVTLTCASSPALSHASVEEILPDNTEHLAGPVNVIVITPEVDDSDVSIMEVSESGLPKVKTKQQLVKSQSGFLNDSVIEINESVPRSEKRKRAKHKSDAVIDLTVNDSIDLTLDDSFLCDIIDLCDEAETPTSGSSGEASSTPKTGRSALQYNANRPVSNCEALIAVDTNIFIQDLSYVKWLRTTRNSAYSCVLLVIPWAVIKELDGLKARRGSEVEIAARSAIGYINRCLVSQDTSLIVQTPLEETESSRLLNACGNDDRILCCCLQWQRKLHQQGCGNNIFLLSNDINLRNKALIMNISSFGSQNFHSHLGFQAWLPQTVNLQSSAQLSSVNCVNHCLPTPPASRISASNVPSARAAVPPMPSAALVRRTLPSIAQERLSSTPNNFGVPPKSAAVSSAMPTSKNIEVHASPSHTAVTSLSSQSGLGKSCRPIATSASTMNRVASPNISTMVCTGKGMTSNAAHVSSIRAVTTVAPFVSDKSVLSATSSSSVASKPAMSKTSTTLVVGKPAAILTSSVSVSVKPAASFSEASRTSSTSSTSAGFKFFTSSTTTAVSNSVTSSALTISTPITSLVSFTLKCSKSITNTTSVANKPITSSSCSTLHPLPSENTMDATQLWKELSRELISFLGDLLAADLQKKYNSGWEAVVLHKPPWTFLTLVECYHRHWDAVTVFPLREKKFFSSLMASFGGHKKRNGTPSLKEMETIIDKIKKMARELVQSPAGLVNFVASCRAAQAQSQLDKLKEKYNKLLTCTTTTNS